MHMRHPEEAHRASTPLELFFDLIFVVAVSLNAAALHHGLGGGHVAPALLAYAMQFAVIWWAWMGFTWFASAFDTDDVPYRLMVMLQMVGALVIAAGVPAAFEHQDWRLVVTGYVLVRVGLVVLWLRAARANPAQRATTQRYALGLTLCQALWVGMLFLPKDWGVPVFFMLFALELSVPVLAQRAGRLNFHPDHILERYSLFTIIVLGESVLSTVMSIKNTQAQGQLNMNTGVVVGSAVLIVFSLWWLYFDKPKVNLSHTSNSQASRFWWAYGHYFVFSSAAAVGVGLSVAVECGTGTIGLPLEDAQWAIAIPVAGFLLSLWLVHFKTLRHSALARWGMPATALLVLGSALWPDIVHTMLSIAALTCGLLGSLLLRHYDAHGQTAHATEPH